MEPFPADLPAQLQWAQPSGWTRAYELTSADVVMATLKFQSGFGTLAHAMTAADTWTLKRAGFLHPRVTVRVAGSEEDFAIYQPSGFGGKGIVMFADQNTFRFQCTSFWGGDWAFFDSAEHPLVRFHNRGIMKHGAVVDLEPAGRERSELPLLLILGWYLLVLYQQDAGGTIAGTTVATM